MARPGAPRTKIVCTIGPACDAPDVLERMIHSGMTVARINLAHGTPDEQATYIATVRAVARRTGSPVAVMCDLAGPKIRIGDLAGGKVTLENGKHLHLTTEPMLGTASRISVTEPRLAHDVRKGDPIFLADGTLELRAVHMSGTEIECEVVNGGLLLPAKGVNVPNTQLRVPGITKKDREDLARVLRVGVDAVALSFVREAADVHQVRRLMGKHPVPVIAKIEKREAIEDLDAILESAEGVMVARGDLAVETSLEELPLLQKRIIRAANDIGKPVITATQMLLSMVESPRPTRAEAADVANAILDGTDAVMLSEETARGRNPARVVATMARIAQAAELALRSESMRHRTQRHSFVAGAVSEAAVHVAGQVAARAIVTPTHGGATPRFVARLRPPMPVVALTGNASTVQFLCFTWGVHPIHRPGLGAFDATVRQAGHELLRMGLAKRGERFVITAGYPRRTASNLMTVQVA